MPLVSHSTSPSPPHVFRYYVRTDAERWNAHCVDLDLWASEGSLDAARKSLHEAISGYLGTVYDTEDSRFNSKSHPNRKVMTNYEAFGEKMMYGKNEWFDDPRELIAAVRRVVHVSSETALIIEHLSESFDIEVDIQ